jgi:uncharacterized protein (TIGR02145 family)
MKYIVTFLLAALSLNAIAQINPNYNPDYDANGVIGVDDLLGILSTFGDTWDSGDVIVGCTYPYAVEYNSSANVDDGSCTFLPDCAGVINGTSVVDECGVCDGDNTSCEDCAGVINGTSVVDECGVCGGDNTSCEDCAGVINGTSVVDECGVCGGSGIPEGECDCDGNVLDECGSCGGSGIPEGECDCDGNVLDECGSCGGSGIPEGECDCDGNVLDECGSCGGSGIPEGECDCDGNVLDECGSCGGSGIPEGECDCDGNVLDECGSCGGSGIPEGECDCDGNVLDECGVCGGDNSTCLDACGVPNGDNSTCTDCLGVVNGDGLVSHEGYDYSTVLIGEQCWFAENCRYLPIVSDPSIDSTTEPHYSVYGYIGTDVEDAKGTFNYETYGVLYNWPAVITEGICPSGWHIPSDGEFTELSDFLGGEGVAGGKMKEAGYDHWNSPNTGATNSSGWTGLPGGYGYSGNFNNKGGRGYWWSASEHGSYSWTRVLYKSSGNVHRLWDDRFLGFSARCVRD